MQTDDLSLNFRQAMRVFPATVSVVTCDVGGDPVGATVSAVSSLSMDPPSLLVCINRSSSIYPFISKAPRFCINVLQPNHETLAGEFAGRSPQGAPRFKHGDWIMHTKDAPALGDARINMFCDRVNMIDHGTHAIIIGNVSRISIQGYAAALYGDGSYGQFTPSRKRQILGALAQPFEVRVTGN